MNKLLPNLPMEIVTKILITRPTHPIADILKNYIELHHYFIFYKINYLISEYDNYDCSGEFDKFMIYGYYNSFL